MKFIHLSDLHLGKRVNDYSMIEDQRYILDKIVGIIREEKPQAVLIAGDVYDKPVPPAEAVTLFDDFFMYIFDCTHIQTAGRLHEDDQGRMLLDLSADDGLLLINAAHRPHDGLAALAARR